MKADQATARYRNGVLEVRVPKADAAKGRGYKSKDRRGRVPEPISPFCCIGLDCFDNWVQNH